MKMKSFENLFVALAVGATIFLTACAPDKPAPKKAEAAVSKADSAPNKTDATDKKLIVGLDDNFTPMEFRGKGNVLMGYDIDLSREAFKRLNIPFDYKSISWGAKDDELLKDKTIDVIWSALNITDERRGLYALTDAYISNSQVVVVPVGSPIAQATDLVGKKVGVVKNGWVQGELAKDPSLTGGEVAEFVELPSAAQILSELLTGSIDAVVADKVTVDYYVANSPGKFVLVEGFFETGMGVAVRPDETELRNKINKVLADMKADGTERAIYKKWFGE